MMKISSVLIRSEVPEESQYPLTAETSGREGCGFCEALHSSGSQHKSYVLIEACSRMISWDCMIIQGLEVVSAMGVDRQRRKSEGILC